jgi:hypothetical protein
LNAPAGVTQPALIHPGRCDNLDKVPKWPLEAMKNGKSDTEVPASIDAILKDRTAITVRFIPNHLRSCLNLSIDSCGRS